MTDWSFTSFVEVIFFNLFFLIFNFNVNLFEMLILGNR